jgi:cytochrome c peroxidase
VTKQDQDEGAFKTPTLRDLLKTAPYMHDGSVKTLEEVVELYDRGGEPNPWLDPKMVKLGLTTEEKKDLVAFMRALEGDWKPMAPPKLPE